MASTRGFNIYDPGEWQAKSLQAAGHRIEIIGDGETAWDALTNLATLGVSLPKMGTPLGKYLETHPCLLTLEAVDLGYHAISETGPYELDAGIVQPIFPLQENTMGRLAVLGVHLMEMPQMNSTMLRCGNQGVFSQDQMSGHLGHHATNILTYLHLKSVPVSGHAQRVSIPGRDLPLNTHYYHYYELPSHTQTPIVCQDVFNTKFKIRFSYTLMKPMWANNRIQNCAYDASLGLDESWVKPTTKHGLVFLDEFTLLNVNEVPSASLEGDHGTQQTPDNANMIDPSVAATLKNLRVPIRLIFNIRPVHQPVQMYAPFHQPMT
jgi:hypothetical protein